MTATSCSDSTECSSSSREQELGSSAHGPWDGHWSADEDVLKDKAVMACYMRAIVEHGAVEGKTVLDLSCGSGILSLLAARHGATHVYSVDVPPIIDLLKKIAEQNDLADKITCIPAQYVAISAPLNLPSESDPSPAMCRARRLSYQLPVEKVDVIMFRSFGFCIFSESSWLIDLIYARDHFLKPSGLLLPDKLNMYVAAVEDAAYKKSKILWWENVYGFDMSVLRDCAFQEPLVDEVKPSQVVTNCPAVGSIDLYAVDRLRFNFSFNLRGSTNDFIHAFLLHFSVVFFSDPSRSPPVRSFGFSTGPSAAETHWQQTLLYLKEVLLLCKDDTLTGQLLLAPALDDASKLAVELSYSFAGTYGQVRGHQSYVL